MSIYEFHEEDARAFARHVGAKVRRSGDELIFNVCPYCHGEEKSNREKFAINLKTGQFNCLRSSCRAKGNMITLSKAFDFPLPGYADEYYNSRKKYVNLSRAKRPETTDPAIQYLKDRGISEDITKKYEITTKDKDGSLILFPFYDENNTLQMIKFRNTKATKENGLNKEWPYKSGDLSCKPILFGMNHCSAENKQLIITEGQIDAMSVAEAGYTNVVSVPMGVNNFTWIPYCWNFLQQFEKLIVFGDYEHGRITLLEDMQTYFNGSVLHVLPENYKGCKDANEILQKCGVNQIRECIANAVEVGNKSFIRLSEIRPKPISEMEKIDTGLETLNKTLGGFFFGQLIVLTGERGEGKSTLSNQFALSAVNAGIKTFIYSGELPNGSLRDWIDHQAAGSWNVKENHNSFGDCYYDLSKETADKIAAWYSDYLWIYQNQFLEDPEAEEDQTVVDIVTDAVKRGFRFIIIDNLMTAMDDDPKLDLYRAQTKFVKQLVRLAKAKDVLIMLIAHQRKNQGTNRTADDVSGSANITNLADIVMAFGKPKEKSVNADREIRIQKNRLTGRLGDAVPMWYEESTRRVSDDQSSFSWRYKWEQQDANGFYDAEQIENPFELTGEES